MKTTGTEPGKTKTMSNIKCVIGECGNGFPDVGSYVPGSDGNLYRVVSTGHIFTRGCGTGNGMHATVEPADYDDCPEDDEFPA